jgi:hypothetical protein
VRRQTTAIFGDNLLPATTRERQDSVDFGRREEIPAKNNLYRIFYVMKYSQNHI